MTSLLPLHEVVAHPRFTGITLYNHGAVDQPIHESKCIEVVHTAWSVGKVSVRGRGRANQ
jgi:hypothetical protein